MKAAVGDQLHVHGRTVEQPDRTGTIIEVRGDNGEPPYMVRFDDGHQGLVYPGGDCSIEVPESRKPEKA